MPLLTIGMPVYNAERYLVETLESLLNQTFTDFELIISDNASTDRTEEICRKYAARDNRIRYSRNAKNMGAGWNFNHVYTLATGKYYKQAAHDDVCERTFFETCIRALEQDPSLTVAYTKARIVDKDGALIEEYECPLRTDRADPVVRFADLVLVDHRCFQIFGIHRMSALKQLPPMGSFPHADGILLAQLGLLGRFYEAPERSFVSRRHESQSVWTVASRSGKRKFRLTDKVGRLPSLEWWDTSRSRTITFPEWHIFGQYCRSIHHSPLSAWQKIRAYGVMMRWMAKYRRKLLGDFVLAADQMLWIWQSSRERRKRPKADEKFTVEAQGGKTV